MKFFAFLCRWHVDTIRCRSISYAIDQWYRTRKRLPVFDGRTFAEAYRIASHVISMALGCIVPPIIGYLTDRWLSISPVGVTIGSILGFLWLIVRIREFAAQSSSNMKTPHS